MREAARLAPTFKAQDAANTLWALAKLGVSDAGLVRPLAEAAVRLAPTFNAQGTANTLWALAALGVSDAGLTRPLAEAAVRLAPTFNAQEAANTLWAAASLGLREASLVASFITAVARHSHGFALDAASSVLQAHYAGLSVGAGCLADCWRVLRAAPRPPTASHLQTEVATVLRSMGLCVELEVPILEGLRCIDIVVTAPSGNRVAVEVDGPSHFFELPQLGAAPRWQPRPTLLRDCHTAAAGYTARATIPFFAWNLCKSVEEQRQFLEKELDQAFVRVGLA